MGLSGISPGSLLLILVILFFVMGGKRLRTLGEDLGIAYKSFKKALNDESDEKDPEHVKLLKDQNNNKS